MSSLDQLQLVGEEIERELARFRSKRLRDKRKAAWLKIGAVLCAALVTVLLGLQSADPQLAATLKNVALALGAAIAVLNAYDAFFDHRALWIRRTETVANLHELWMDFRFYSAAVKNAGPDATDGPDSATLGQFKDRLTRILHDDSREWLRLRTPTPEEQPGRRRAQPQPVTDAAGGRQ